MMGDSSHNSHTMPASSFHPVQASILQMLRHTASARYSDLMRPSGLESDSFKFHLRSLVQRGFVQKNGTAYTLTAQGKELANNFDDAERTVQKQPKLTLRICLSRINQVGETEFLFQERLRNPYWGYWDTIGGPVLWGESIEDAANRELAKQTGLQATAAVKAFYRVRDFNETTGELLEDKLFVVLSADAYEGEVTDSWPGGHNAWMTVEQLLQTGKYFASTPKMIDLLNSGLSYASEDIRYTLDDY